MHEMHRMLGREHEADLERDAKKWRLAAEVRREPSATPGAPKTPASQRSRRSPSLVRMLGFVLSQVRHED